MKKIVLSCAALCLLAASSCKKKEDDPSRQDLLTRGKWLMTANKSHVTISDSTVTTDEYASLDACEKDDLTIFRTDNHLITDQGATKCDPSDPQQSDEGIWSLTESDSKLLVTNSGFSAVFKINALNGGALEIETSDTMSGIVYRQVVGFSHVD